MSFKSESKTCLFRKLNYILLLIIYLFGMQLKKYTPTVQIVFVGNLGRQIVAMPISNIGLILSTPQFIQFSSNKRPTTIFCTFQQLLPDYQLV